MTGFNFASTTNIFLESGRLIEDTCSWNPLTFALVLGKTELLQFILQHAILIEELLAIEVNLREIDNHQMYSKEELVEGQLKTMMLLVENKSPNF